MCVKVMHAFSAIVFQHCLGAYQLGLVFSRTHLIRAVQQSELKSIPTCIFVKPIHRLIQRQPRHCMTPRHILNRPDIPACFAPWSQISMASRSKKTFPVMSQLHQCSAQFRDVFVVNNSSVLRACEFELTIRLEQNRPTAVQNQQCNHTNYTKD